MRINLIACKYLSELPVHYKWPACNKDPRPSKQITRNPIKISWIRILRVTYNRDYSIIMCIIRHVNLKLRTEGNHVRVRELGSIRCFKILILLMTHNRFFLYIKVRTCSASASGGRHWAPGSAGSCAHDDCIYLYTSVYRSAIIIISNDSLYSLYSQASTLARSRTRSLPNSLARSLTHSYMYVADRGLITSDCLHIIHF